MEKKYTFSQRLRELLQIFDIKQTELSIKTGISKSSISHYLKGDWEGKQDAVYKIASSFGISEAWLMGVDVPLYPVPRTDVSKTGNSDVMSIGKRIKQARKAKRLSQTELANAVHISKQTLWKYENDIIVNIPSGVIEAIADYLCIPPTFLMGWENTVSPAPAASDVLTEKEHHLLTGFRELNELGQEAVLTTLDGFTHNPVYKKCPAPASADKQA